MSRKIFQVLRGLKAKIPHLSTGEFGLCEDENLYIGTPTGNKRIPWDSEIPTKPSDIGAAESKHTHTASEVGAVPTDRKVNGKTLSSDITLTASDVSASASNHKHSASDITSGTLSVSRGGTGLTSLTNSSYGVNQMRGIYFSMSEPSSVPNGCVCLVYI